MNTDTERTISFMTDNSVVEKIPKSIKEAEDMLAASQAALSKAVTMVTALCCATPSSIAPKGEKPLEYAVNAFGRYYKSYEDSVFAYCDLLLMCNEYYGLPEGRRRESYFTDFKRTIEIEGCAISGGEERRKLYGRCWEESESLRVRLLGFASATPSGVAPQEREPVDYVASEVRAAFEKILDLSLAMLKLTFLENEEMYFKNPACKETGQDKRAAWFWENMVVKQ